MVANRYGHGLHYALLASLALHALALFAFTDWREPARRVLQYPTVLVARLMAPEPAPPQPAPPVEKEKPAPPARKKAPAREAVVSPAPAIAPPAEAPVAQPSAPPPPIAAAQPAAPAVAPSAGELTVQSADQYRMALIESARLIKDRKRYPPQAYENNWQGDVAVGISIAANGRPSISVRRSSQYEVLDRQAVEILEQALREVPMPSALRGKELALRDVTVSYRLPRN